MSAFPNSLFPVPSAPIPQNQSRGESYKKKDGFTLPAIDCKGLTIWTYLDEFRIAGIEEHLFQIFMLCKLEFQGRFHLQLS